MSTQPNHATPIDPYHYRQQLIVVSLSILAVIAVAFSFTFFMWNLFCDEKITTCFVIPNTISTLTFCLLALLRPITLMPFSYFAVIVSHAFVLQGSVLGGFFALWLSAVISHPIAFFLGNLLHHRMVNPWLLTNVPYNIKRAQQESFHITMIFRSLFFLHYDGLNFLSGLLGFNYLSTLKATIFVEGVKALIFAGVVYITQDPIVALLYLYMYGIMFLIIVFCIGQICSHFKGKSWMVHCKRIYASTFSEIQLNNNVQTDHNFYGERPPVLLLYGFFASRRTLSVIEKLLQQKGYEVFSLNMGGLFGVFFTNSIIDSARLVDQKLSHIMQVQKRKRIHIVAHSKGGLVALWWALRLGGHQYCHKIITMGTPFQGSYYTYLALVTPLGLWWKDVWQMRPRSKLLKALEDTYIPEHLRVYCFYSAADRIAFGKSGVFSPQYGSIDNVVPIPMHSISHFEYLYRKRVAEKIDEMLQQDKE